MRGARSGTRGTPLELSRRRRPDVTGASSIRASPPVNWGTCSRPSTFARRRQPICRRFRSAYRPAPLHIINNGHTIQVDYEPGSSITVGDRRYELKQFHFHHPSEEKINGKGYAMVAHLVHAAADGSLAVVAVLLDARSSANPLVARLWQYLPAQEGPEKTHDDVQIDATGLLPTDRGYYTFTGSLTTPPCTENVTWFVLKAPEPISQAQADAFGRIYQRDARPTQPLNGRDVLMSQ